MHQQNQQHKNFHIHMYKQYSLVLHMLDLQLLQYNNVHVHSYIQYKHLVSADIVIRIRGIIIDIKLKSTCIRIIIEIATEIRYTASVEIRIITKGVQVVQLSAYYNCL